MDRFGKTDSPKVHRSIDPVSSILSLGTGSGNETLRFKKKAAAYQERAVAPHAGPAGLYAAKVP